MVKRARSRNSCVGDDRISKLPDGIRCHILSFLPAIDVVATTLISKMWKNLWTTALNDIEVHDYQPPFECGCGVGESESRNNMKFARFVNQLLGLHNAQVLKRFSLNCTEGSPLYDYQSWITMVMVKKIEDLRVYVGDDGFLGEELIHLPISLFSCETLKVLKLSGNIFVPMLTSCSLPRVKKLRLYFVKYENDESARKLISSCPSLESLDITRDTVDRVENYIISSSTLRYLRIDHGNDYYERFQDSDSVTSNHVIKTPALQHLELIEGPPGSGFSIENSPSLVKTDIKQWEIIERSEWFDHNFINLLQGICNSMILNIETGFCNVLNPWTDEFEYAISAHLFPKFNRLSALNVKSECCDWNSLQEFINNSDRLETLEFTMSHNWSSWNDELEPCWRNPETVPICLLSSLKTMIYSGFSGLEDEVRMLEYIFSNAKVMQKMEIVFQHPPKENRITETQLRRKLLNVPKGSEECQVIIS